MFDPNQFQRSFEQIFDAKILSWRTEDRTPWEPMHIAGQYSPSHLTQLGPNMYEINIRCHIEKIPITPIDHFFVPGHSNQLIMVQHRLVMHSVHEFDLRYKVLSLDLFMDDVEKMRREKFNENFHSQLEGILDDGTEEG